MTKERLSLGKMGEELAAAALKGVGYRIVKRNYRCRSGEVDIVAIDGKIVVFVEVKTRSSEEYGPPQLGVDKRKQRQLSRAAMIYLKEKKLLKWPARFDVVGIVVRGKSHDIEHIKNAFNVVE
ncbi:MAG: YraN family protein [Thermodesulfobacteriota bacterium]